MDVIVRTVRGAGRVLGLAVGNPKLLIVVAVIGVYLVLRRQSQAQEVRERHKDPWTLIGLFTWRPMWWWRAPLALVGVGVWAGSRGRGSSTVAAAALAVLVIVRFAVPLQWERIAIAERGHQWCSRWAWRWTWACLLCDTLGRERWGPKSPYPVPTRVELHGDNAVLTVRLPPKLDLAGLRLSGGALGAQLHAKGLRVLPSASGDMAYARVEVLNRTLAPGRRLDRKNGHLFDIRSERYLTVGFGHAGPVHFDLDNEVGLGIFGATGAGKGVLARWLAVQVLGISGSCQDPLQISGSRHDLVGRELWIIDPQSSAEWSPFAGLPGVRLLSYDPVRPAESLAAIDRALDELAVDVAERNALCAAEGADSWRHLSSTRRAVTPRRLILVDEVTSLLGKVERSDPTAKLRESIGVKLGATYRTVRKAGVAFVHVDQATFQGNSTYLADGSIGQLGRWVALGGMRDETRRMISGFTDWPYVASVPGLGLTGRRADPMPEPIEIPEVTRRDVEAALEHYSAAVRSASAQPALTPGPPTPAAGPADRP